MGFVLFLFALLSLTLGVACRPISSVRLSPDETKSFSSECSVNSTLTVKYDEQSGSIKCTFISHEPLPPGVQYRQTTTAGNRTVESTVNCSRNTRKCFAVADVGDFVSPTVNCSMVFNAMDGRFMSCFNYSFPIGMNSTSGFVPPTSERKRDMYWLLGLFFSLAFAVVVSWLITAGVFYKRMKSKVNKCEMDDDLQTLRRNFEEKMKDLSKKYDDRLERLNDDFKNSLETERDKHNEEKVELQQEINRRIEELKVQYEKDQEILKMRIAATKPSPPLSRSSLNSASVPHELSKRRSVEKAMAVGSGGFQKSYNRQYSDPVSEFEPSDLPTSLGRKGPYLPAQDSSIDLSDTTISFTIAESDSEM